MKLNYEDDLRIDDSALDVEWLEQSSLAMKYGRNCAKLERDLQLLTEKKKVINADLTLRCAKDPTKYLGAAKPTGDNVKAAIAFNAEFVAISEEVVEAAYELEIAKIAYKEISTTRKAALQNLVELFARSYFAGPNVPRDLTSEVARKAEKQHQQKTRDVGVAKKLTRKKRN